MKSPLEVVRGQPVTCGEIEGQERYKAGDIPEPMQQWYVEVCLLLGAAFRGTSLCVMFPLSWKECLEVDSSLELGMMNDWFGRLMGDFGVVGG